MSKFVIPSQSLELYLKLRHLFGLSDSSELVKKSKVKPRPFDPFLNFCETGQPKVLKLETQIILECNYHQYHENELIHAAIESAFKDGRADRTRSTLNAQLMRSDLGYLGHVAVSIAHLDLATALFLTPPKKFVQTMAPGYHLNVTIWHMLNNGYVIDIINSDKVTVKLPWRECYKLEHDIVAHWAKVTRGHDEYDEFYQAVISVIRNQEHCQQKLMSLLKSPDASTFY